MCGIAGYLNLDPQQPVDPTIVERMRDRIAHRGPDGEGLFASGPVGLGHRRLSVIDLEGGRQPMLSADGSKAIVYNGEVYNFRELRSELSRRGRTFRTRSDTEVVLAMYEEHGCDFAARLDGMFAIAIWDEERSRLVLVRDRLGIKPLYVHETHERLAFASEIKALLEVPKIDTSWDRQALHDYFHFLYVPSPRTAYRSIRQLPPGTVLVAENREVREERFWELEPGELSTSSDSLGDLTHLLQESVAARMVADVPVGCFLSGGIDSGMVAAFMSRANPDPVRSFTVFDPEIPFYDERERARLVAERYGTDHRELVAATEVEALSDLVVPTFDEPFADSGALPNLIVCREGRKHVTVALSGLGGDEIGGGYSRYLGMQVNRALGRVPRLISRLLGRAVDLLPEGRGLALDRAKRFARLLGLEEAEAYTRLVSSGLRLRRPVIAEQLRSDVDPSSPLEEIGACLERARALGCDPLNRLLYTDLVTYVPNDLLVLADRTSMRAGLEVRVPFLDHRLVERALAIPGGEKIRGSELKAGLRRLAGSWLPAEVVTGPKRGFSVPMADWLRGPLRDAMTRAVEVTAPETGLLDRDALREAWRAHAGGNENHEEILWATLVFARWAESSR